MNPTPLEILKNIHKTNKWIMSYVEYYLCDSQKNEIYAKNICNNEFYIINLSDFSVKYAKYADGRIKFAKDLKGNEIYGSLIRGNQFPPRYTKNVDDSENYPRNEVGDEVYLKNENNEEIFAKDRHGNENYAKKWNGDQYYPFKNKIAKYFDGQPKYAFNEDTKIIFPKDDKNSEYYITDPQTGKDYIGGVGRYAINNLKRQIYPIMFDNDVYYEMIINNSYALDENNDPYYPLDAFGNEYTLKLRNGSNVYTKDYPITNDGYIILPFNGKMLYDIKAELLPVSNIEKTIIGEILQSPTKGFLTNIKSRRVSRSPFISYITNKEYVDVYKKQDNILNTSTNILHNTSFYHTVLWIIFAIIFSVIGIILYYFVKI